jgi:hypothetical protein
MVFGARSDCGAKEHFSSAADTIRVKKMRENKKLEHNRIQLDRIMLQRSNGIAFR